MGKKISERGPVGFVEGRDRSGVSSSMRSGASSLQLSSLTSPAGVGESGKNAGVGESADNVGENDAKNSALVYFWGKFIIQCAKNARKINFYQTA